MAEKSNSLSKTFVWVLLGLLIIGLAGFGATSFGGNIRSIGNVGDTEIDANDYARAIQNEIQTRVRQTGQPLSMQQVQSMGIPEQVLSQLIVTAALENEAASLGLSVGDERLAADLRAIPAFQGADGSFNRDAYRMTLGRIGLSEREFEEQLRSESASTLLQGAVLAGTRLPDIYLDTLIGYTGERRSFTWAEMTAGALDTGLPAPTEDELQAWYDDNIDRFTRPESTRLTYGWLTPEMIVDTVEVDEALLRESYESRLSEFRLPERRLAERLVFADQAAAEAALARVNAGEASFEDLVADRGLALADTDLGDVTREDLETAADIVFGGSIGAVVGPAPSPLGPALFRVNAVLQAQETSFEDATPMLRDELALDRARRVIESQAREFDDEMAAGATLEELAETTDLQLGTIDWTGQNEDPIAGYDAFRDAASRVTEDDFPAIDTLGDGGIFALRYEDVTPAAPIPFEEVRLEVIAGWQENARLDALVAEAEIVAGSLSEGTTFEGAGLVPNSESGMTRTGFSIDLPNGMLDTVFTLEPGAVTTMRGDGVALIVRLDEIVEADRDSEEAQQLSQIFGDRAAQEIAQDLFRALSTDIQDRAGVVVDQQALNAIHASIQ